MSGRSLKRLPALTTLSFFGAAVLLTGTLAGAEAVVYSLHAVTGCPEREELVITPTSSVGLPEGKYYSEEIVTVCRHPVDNVKCDDMTEEWNYQGHSIPNDPNGCIIFMFLDSDVYLTSMPICDCVFPDSPHPLDANANWRIELGEVLRIIQLYNSDGFHCEPGTEDGYGIGPGSTNTCPRLLADYEAPNWRISLSEVLRIVQFYNSYGYFECFEAPDGYCLIG